ncbi:MAG: hypothetical protein PF484_02915 [Bacteroidales bacterium]|jgi:hypothetical protein|nr:hypothetical protein [Bacteroidales bacterium]
MNTENKIEEKINGKLNRTKNAGFTNPPANYFEHFADNLTLKKNNEGKKIILPFSRNKWLQFSSYAVAAVLLLALWIFVFDANIKNDMDVNFTIEELMAVNDFQNYNEDLIYSELTLVSDADIYSNEVDIDVLLDFGNISTDEIIELYSKEDLK